MKNFIIDLKNKIESLAKKKYFFEIYSALVCVLSIISWAFLPQGGLSILMVFCAIVLFVLNDFKYILPAFLNFIFVNGSSFEAGKTPIALIVCATLLIISIVVFFFKNKKRIYFGRFSKTFIPLAILGIIPIFWSAIKINPGTEGLYILYFSWVLYYIIYLLVINSIKGNVLHELSVSLSFMGVLIASECIIETFRVLPNFENVFSVYYELGWGLCNEAGIMMCVSFPFLMYLIVKENWKLKIINILKALVIFIGVILTTSRGTLLTFILELILCIIVIIYKNRKNKIVISGMICGAAVILLAIIIERDLVKIAISKIFDLGFSGNGRKELFEMAYEHFDKSFKTILFGDGIVNGFFTPSSDSMWEGTRFYVYHSTFFQTIAMMGVIGLTFMIGHFVQKYALLFKNKSIFTVFAFISFICVDLYGMIDNTYHMYYYMIILIVILGAMEIAYNENLECEEKNMNKSNGMNIKTILNIFKKNGIIIVITIGVFLCLAFVGSRVIFSSNSAKSSVLIVTNVDVENTNYEIRVKEYKDTALEYLKSDLVLEGVSKKYDISMKKLNSNITYSIEGSVAYIVYSGGETISQSQDILNSIVDSWMDYINETEILGIRANTKKSSPAKENTDMSTKKMLFSCAVAFIGIIAGFVLAALKGFYWYDFEEESLVCTVIKKPVNAFIRYNKQAHYETNENELEIKKLLIEINRSNFKAIEIMSIGNNNKLELVKMIYSIVKDNDNNVCILKIGKNNFDYNDLNVISLNPKSLKINDNEIDLKIKELKSQYDFIIVINEDDNDLNDFVSNKYVDATILNIQILGARKKETLDSLSILEKDNDNIFVAVTK